MSSDTVTTNDDPFGRRAAALEAVEDLSGNVPHGEVAALLAIGRCHLGGLSLPSSQLDLALSRSDAAQVQLIAELPDWTLSAGTLGERWDDADPDCIDELVIAMLDLRTALWGAQRVLEDSGYPINSTLLDKIKLFDAALRGQLSILATQVGTSWLLATRSELKTRELPWWLGTQLELEAERTRAEADLTMPSHEQWRLVRTAIRFRRSLPQRAARGSPAARQSSSSPYSASSLLLWHSPQGDYQAELRLPPYLKSTDWTRPLVFRFWRLDEDIEASDLAGQPMRLGRFEGMIDSMGRLKLTVDDLKEELDGRLFVGSPGEEWHMLLEEERPS